MSDRTAVTVRIAGEEHAIRSAAPPEYTRRCARLVDERITEIRRRSGLVEGHRAAILAALSITDEFFQAQEELERLRAVVAERTEAVVERLDGALGGVE
ncbi:MAG: cell division protein ZapA [Gemmatimonadetes bacterium]|nr:cell division protein ZapA [Gemmatimonadota bacterium]NNF39077.1 cell division protein ZapA [Gemmatimonadota bacterium]NNK62774.1 cell division protein ZapA [Gemmatimonadota bacterium]